MFDFFDHLNSTNAYFRDNSFNVYPDFPTAVQSVEKPVLDPVALFSFLNKNYILNNRTVVQGLNKSPWLARPDSAGDWEYAEVPNHGNRIVSIAQAAETMKKIAADEISRYSKGCKKIGILLSGGMDSRILAGVLYEYQQSLNPAPEIVCYSWGKTDSRDVVYAEKIANAFSWDFCHIALTSDILYQNIFEAGKHGAEYSPLHLHGMVDVRDRTDCDVILAASYGDSMGRAEFSGTHLSRLKPILKTNLNRFEFFNSKLKAQYDKELVKDAYTYQSRIKRTAEYQYAELERYIHYMRRQLSSAMCIITEKVPLHQVFTSPEMYKFIWDLDVSMRNDLLYESVLKSLPDILMDIPWARTGRLYGDENKPGKSLDSYSKENNEYGKWLRDELGAEVYKIIMGSGLLESKYFNKVSIKSKLKIFLNYRGTPKADRLDEKISWLASLAHCTDLYTIDIFSDPNRDPDRNIVLSDLEAVIYRKFRNLIK